MQVAFRQLVLCPSDMLWNPASREDYVAMLQRIGMLGSLLDETQTDRYLIGDAFLQQFSFMGCAPSIEFQPADTGKIDWHEFVFIHLSQVFIQPRWLVEQDSAKPACPHCQRRTRNWLASYQADSAQVGCPHCQHSAPVCEWRWFDAGGCARQFISIANVYPKESIPTDSLLSQLQLETGVGWHYFYLNAPLIKD